MFRFLFGFLVSTRNRVGNKRRGVRRAVDSRQESASIFLIFKPVTSNHGRVSSLQANLVLFFWRSLHFFLFFFLFFFFCSSRQTRNATFYFNLRCTQTVITFRRNNIFQVNIVAPFLGFSFAARLTCVCFVFILLYFFNEMIHEWWLASRR